MDGGEFPFYCPNLKGQFPFMKKYLFIAAVGLLTTAGVTATVIGSSKKKTIKQSVKKTCPHKCTKSASTACY